MKTRTSQLGELLRKSRKSLGLSQADVAHKLGLTSGQSVSDWERGYGSRVPIKTLKILISLYRLDQHVVLQLYINQEKDKLARKIESEFFKSAKSEAPIAINIKVEEPVA